MKILIFCMVLLAVNSLVPNCAFQSNNRCLSCYYGFELVSGKCDTCSARFVMVREICVDQALYQQQVNLQNQLNALNTSSGTSINQQSQSQSQSFVPTPTTILPVQTTQLTNQLQTSQNTNTSSTTSSTISSSTTAFPIMTPTTPSITTTTSSVSTSNTNQNTMTFDITNTGVMYLLQLFGLTSKIPLNCQQFTTDFRCVKCTTGYVVSPAATCVMVSTINVVNTNTGSTSTSTSSTSQTASSSSSTSSNSSTTGSSVTVSNNNNNILNNDPNCQYPGQNGQCSQCYFRYFYNLNDKKCIQVNDLCATWDKSGNCVTCYGGYQLANGVCFINYQTSGSSNGSSSTVVNAQGSTTTSGTTTGTTTGSNSQSSTSSSTGTTSGSTSQSTQTSTTSQTPLVNNQQSSTSGNTLLISSTDPNCKSMGINGVCYECYYSYVYNTQSGRCVPVNPLCQTWNYLGHCFSCFPGYVLSGTQCVVGSSASVTGNAGSGSSASSSTVTGGSSSSSTTSSSTTSSSSSTGSSTSSTGVQTSGTSQTSSGLITIINNDPNCRSPNSDGTCSSCYNTFYYDSVNAKRCVSVNPLCRTWNNFGHCQSCYQGYLLSLNSCVIQSAYIPSVLVGSNDLPSTNQDPNCNTYRNQVCIKCATRTYLDPTTKRCLAVDANCMQWTETGICTNCYNGYYLFNQRQCRLFYPQVASVQLKSSANSDINCRASDSNGVCTQCIWRFVLNPTSKICMKVHDQCKTWSQTTALCTSCYGGYTLTSGGQCKVSY